MKVILLCHDKWLGYYHIIPPKNENFALNNEKNFRFTSNDLLEEADNIEWKDFV